MENLLHIKKRNEHEQTSDENEQWYNNEWQKWVEKEKKKKFNSTWFYKLLNQSSR